MDPFSLAVGIASLAGLATSTIRFAKSYISGVKHGEESIANLITELEALQVNLASLDAFLQAPLPGTSLSNQPRFFDHVPRPARPVSKSCVRSWIKQERARAVAFCGHSARKSIRRLCKTCGTSASGFNFHYLSMDVHCYHELLMMC